MLTIFREWIYRSCIQGCVACPCERCVALISWVIVTNRCKDEVKGTIAGSDDGHSFFNL